MTSVLLPQAYAGLVTTGHEATSFKTTGDVLLAWRSYPIAGVGFSCRRASFVAAGQVLGTA
jgi:hypothetical protein